MYMKRKFRAEQIMIKLLIQMLSLSPSSSDSAIEKDIFR